METDLELYKGMKFSNLVAEIVENSRSKRQQIDILISDLRLHIKGPNDVVMIVPLIRDYIDVGVKNDDQLVKLAAVIQRIMNSRPSASDEGSVGFSLTDEEKKQLQEEIDKIKKSDENISKFSKQLSEKSDEV